MDLVVFFFYFQIVCWDPPSSCSTNRCVMSCVTVRGIILQFGSGCSLTDGPSVVKTVWREQKIGLHRSFTSNIYQQFNLSLTPCYLFWCCVFWRHIALISRENKTYQSLVRKLLQIIESSEVRWSTAWAVSNSYPSKSVVTSLFCKILKLLCKTYLPVS